MLATNALKKAAWLAVIGLFITGLILGLPAQPKTGFPKIEVPVIPVIETPHIRLLNDLNYGTSPKQKLDLYLPANTQKPFTTVFFIHGGSWTNGDRVMYGHLGRYFASNGIGCIIPSYRLYPEVKCDGEINDLTQAFIWTQNHLEEYGGQKGRLFLFGHSSGAHLASLLATNTQFLSLVGHSPNEIKGVIAMSGLYTVDWNVKIAGLNQIFDGLDKIKYSPANFVVSSPPFLVMYAENDYRHLIRQGKSFLNKLIEAGNPAELFVVPQEDHASEIIHLVLPDSPHGKKIIDWLQTHQ